MFEELSQYRTVIVTGPHRTGTTICAEMIGHDTGKKVIREESFKWRNIIKAEELIYEGGVFQGPYLLPWAPMFSDDETLVVFMKRHGADIDASVEKLKQRGISVPYFDWSQADRLWEAISHVIDNKMEVEYESLKSHPLWVDNREEWGHRQTS